LFLSNEATFDEFLNFSFDCLYDVRSKSSLHLFDWFSILFDVETMHGHLRIKIRQVFIAPSKDIYIYIFIRDIRFFFSIDDKPLLIEMNFGCVRSPTSFGLLYPSQEDHIAQNASLIENQVVELMD